jgi:hypothetical protein
MNEQQPGPTVGSLFGRRQDDAATDLPMPTRTPVSPAPTAADPLSTVSKRIGDRATQESGDWRVRAGILERRAPAPPLPEGVEALDYNNPYGQEIERVWFDGMIVYACDQGQVVVDPATTKVAQEYQIVYRVNLNEDGVPDPEPEQVPGQLNIYDSVPGMEKYSAIWQFNYVVVPRGYVPNTLRSESDCLTSGYPVLRSMRFEN